MSDEEWQSDFEQDSSERSYSEHSGSEQGDFDDEDNSEWVDEAEERARSQARAPPQGRDMLNIRKEMEEIWFSKTLWTLRGAQADALTSRLSSMLDTWRAAKPRTGPQKLLCLLDNVYPHENIRASRLTGSDAQKASVLAQLCAEKGFRLGLAHLRVYLFGTVEDMFGHRKPSRDGRVGFFVEDDRIHVENLVDMDGNLVLQKVVLDGDGDEENVPAGDWWRLNDGPYDRERYDKDAGYVERWFQRTLLVIWPRHRELALRYSWGEGFDSACAELEALPSNEPTAEARALVDLILDHRSGDSEKAARICCERALRWRDPELWQSVIDTFVKERGLEVVPDDMKLQAAEQFTFEVARPSFEAMLEADERNAARLDFLAALRDWAQAHREVVDEVSPWITAQTKAVLASLRMPEDTECPALIAAARANGGLMFLRDQMLPQLQKVAAGPFFLALALAVDDEPSFTDPLKSSTKRALMELALEKTQWYRPPGPKVTYVQVLGPSRPEPPPIDYRARAQAFAAACIKFGYGDLAGVLFARVVKRARASWMDDEAQEVAKKLMLPLIGFVLQEEKENKAYQRPEEFRELRARTLRIYMKLMTANRYRLPDMDEIVPIVEAAVLEDGDAGVLFSEIMPKLDPTLWSSNSTRPLVDALSAVQPRLSKPDKESLDQAIYALAEDYTRSAWMPHAEHVIDVLTWAAGVHAALVQTVVDRVLMKPESWTREHITDVLLPLLPQLRAWTVAHARTDMFAPVAQATVRAWADHVFAVPRAVDPTVAAALNGLHRWTCACTHCAAARDFLQESLDVDMQFYAVGPEVKRHLEVQVKAYVADVAMAKEDRTIPIGMRLYKSDALHQHSAWKAERTRGQQMLRDIGVDEAEVRRVLGAELHARVVSLLSAEPTVAAPSQAKSPTFSTARQAAASSANLLPGNTRRTLMRSSEVAVMPRPKRRKL